MLIVGEKAPPAGSGELTYQLVEREFGRFARPCGSTGLERGAPGQHSVMASSSSYCRKSSTDAAPHSPFR